MNTRISEEKCYVYKNMEEVKNISRQTNFRQAILHKIVVRHTDFNEYDGMIRIEAVAIIKIPVRREDNNIGFKTIVLPSEGAYVFKEWYRKDEMKEIEETQIKQLIEFMKMLNINYTRCSSDDIERT